MLKELCNQINHRSQNYMWISTFDSYIENYLESEQVIWVRKSKNNSIVYIPRYNREYKIIKANDGARAYRGRNVLIDHRISDEIIRVIIVPTLAYCTECYSF